jgi:hypothetical protein
MVYNQLFVIKPSLELTNKLISKFGLKNIKDTREFSILDMNIYNTLNTVKQFENEIANCYIPCKKEKFVSNLDNKALITILRQFLKIHDYDLHSRERFIQNVKYTFYKIVSKKEKIFIKNNTGKPTHKEITVVFD